MSRWITLFFQKVLPTPFTIAILLTLLSFLLAFLFAPFEAEGLTRVFHLLRFWEAGIWNTKLLVFAYQMMLILVLGHVLALSNLAQQLINQLCRWANSTGAAVVLVSVSTLLITFINWGLGLVFGSLLARAMGEKAARENIPLNYPLVGAAAYVGMMVFHGGISGSAPLKVAESGHLKGLMGASFSPALPDFIPTTLTTFSTNNLVLYGLLVLLLPLVLYLMRKTTPSDVSTLPVPIKLQVEHSTPSGMERLTYSFWFSKGIALLFFTAVVVQYATALEQGSLSPNFLNFSMLGCCFLLHKNIHHFLLAVKEAVKGVGGILIQFPLYFGIMGLLSSSGLGQQIAAALVGFATPATLPIITFFSAGILNLFVPSGGGQWAIQGPIIIESAQQLGVSLPKTIMAFAYGDQITNMLQPFWALPLLAITKLKAKELLPYSLIIMAVGGMVFLVDLML